MRSLLTSLLLLSATAAMAENIYSPPTSTVDQGDFELGLEWRQMLSVGTYDENGDTQDFRPGENYERFEYRTIFRYGITSQLELRGGTNFRQNYSWDNSGERSNVHGLQQIMLGLRYSHNLNLRNTLTFDTEARQLIDGEEQYIQLGNEGHYFRIGAAVTSKLPWDIYLAGQSGVAMPAKDQSMEMDFDLSAYWNRGLFAIGGGLNGIVSFGQDDYSDNPEDKPLPPNPSSNTQTIGSINRSYYGAYGAVQLALFKGFRLELKTGQVLDGTSWDQQSFTQVGLVYRHGNERSTPEFKVKKKFKQYDVEAIVLKVSPKKTLIKIDKGLSSNVEKGMRFDIYETDFQGKNVLLAAGRVYKVSAETAVVKILKVYRKRAKIKAGNAARGRR